MYPIPLYNQTFYTRDELIEAFTIDKVGKAGARFDFDKAKWFNQQYIIHADADHLLDRVRPVIAAHGHQPGDDYLVVLSNRSGLWRYNIGDRIRVEMLDGEGASIFGAIDQVVVRHGG